MPRDPDSLTRPGEADLEMDAGQGCPGRWGTGTGRAPAARSSRWANASPRSALPAWLQFRHGLLVPLVTSFSQQNVGVTGTLTLSPFSVLSSFSTDVSSLPRKENLVSRYTAVCPREATPRNNPATWDSGDTQWPFLGTTAHSFGADGGQWSCRGEQTDSRQAPGWPGSPPKVPVEKGHAH